MKVRVSTPGKRQIATVIAIFGCASVTYATLCPEDFGSLLSLDEKFRALSRGLRDPDPLEVSSLLRQAFMPMVTDLNRVVVEAPKKELSGLLHRNLKSTPIFTSAYKREIEMNPYDKRILYFRAVPTVPADSDPFMQRRASAIADVFKGNAGRAAKDFEFFIEASHDPVNGIVIGPAPGLKRKEEFLWAETSQKPSELKYGQAVATMDSLVTPRSAYGDRFSEALIRTTQLMTDLARNHLEPLSHELSTKSPTLLRTETARMKGLLQEGAKDGMGPMNSMTEGILSLHQFFSVMLADKIPGAATGKDALRELIYNGHSRMGLTAEYTSRLPMGFMGPMALSGAHFTKPFVRTKDGKLALSEEMKSFLSKRVEMNAASGHKKGLCPMAALFRPKNADSKQEPKAGLQILAETYWKVFEFVDAELAKAAKK